MSTSSVITSINKLAPDSLAYIFALLPPDERVRLERVCRKWYNVAGPLSWTQFRTLAVDEQELARVFQWALAKYRALISRCGPYLRELFFFGEPWEQSMVQRTTGRANLRQMWFDDFRISAWSTFCLDAELWTRMRNLRHLRFENVFVSSLMLRTIAVSLTHLQSIQFNNIDWRSVAGLHELLRIHSMSLTTLCLPISNSRGNSLHLPALPCSLRALHIIPHKPSSWLGHKDRRHIEELLQLVACCCPQLAILILPKFFSVSNTSLGMLARFEKIFFLRVFFHPSVNKSNLFGNSLASIGPQLRALVLEKVDARVLHLIAQHCPLLEHCYFDLLHCSTYTKEGVLSALQSVLQLAHLRSVSICDNPSDNSIRTGILSAINGLNAKRKIEYLHLSLGLSLSVEQVINMLQANPNLRMLTCAIPRNESPAQLANLNTLLRNMDGPLKLKLLGCYWAPHLEMGQNIRVRLRPYTYPESINQQMLRQFWARATDTMPDLSNLDD